MEPIVKEKPDSRGIFWHGFLLSIAGWLFSVAASAIIFSIISFNQNRGWEDFSINLHMVIPLSVVLLVFWLPISIIAGVQSRKKGYRKIILLVIIAILATSCILPIGVGMLLALGGGF